MAIPTKKAKAGRDPYGVLVELPLRPLRSDAELDRAIGVIDSLISRDDLDPGERDYLDVLTVIVERYETAERPMPAVSDAAMLRHLIDARGVTQSKLAAEVRVPMSTISKVLNGKRRLTRNHIAALAKYFGVSSAVFQP